MSEYQPPTAAFNWYPGHMSKALREIREKIDQVDIVIEVRDARVPYVSGNHNAIKSIKSKARLIVLNKVNLADPAAIKKWEAWFKADGVPFLFLNCLESSSQKTVLKEARRIVDKRREKQSPKMRMMVMGLPNTGKSTFINQIAKRNAAKVANKPGETRHNLWILVDENTQLLDTPGIMPPEIHTEENLNWLCAIHAIPDEISGEEKPARYLIQHFLKTQSKDFQARYKLESFDLSVDEVLERIARLRGCLQNVGGGGYDMDRVHKSVLLDFRDGELGKVCFGTPPKLS